jgi:hypothetical protein
LERDYVLDNYSANAIRIIKKKTIQTRINHFKLNPGKKTNTGDKEIKDGECLSKDIHHLFLPLFEGFRFA